MTRSPLHSTFGLALLLRTLHDFLKGLYGFHVAGPCVTVFGSARVSRDAELYSTAVSLGAALGAAGFAVMTGGGPGLMEAVCRGARAAGGCSLGCRMTFAFEQAGNAYLDRSVTFRYFFVRKVMLCRHACAFVALPGGLGTLDELFEVLTLIQTRKIPPVPIVLIGSAYWRPLVVLLHRMCAEGMLEATDLDVIHITDDVKDATAHVEIHTSRNAERREPAPVATAIPG